MKFLYLILAAVGIGGGLAGCNVINPEEEVPTYVHIDSFSFSGNPALTGSNAHKITNAYVYFNNQSIGIFDLPVTFPILMKQPGVLLVLPGIDFDGLSGYPVPYPFYRADTLSLQPAPGMVRTFAAGTGYTSEAIMRYLADFESGSNPFTRLSGDTSIVATNNAARVFEGAWSGYLKLQAPLDSAVNITVNSFLLPPSRESYIELNYKGTLPFQVGLTTTVNGASVTEYLIGLNPRSSWGKVYIGTRAFASAHQGTQFQLLIRTVMPAGQSEGELVLDNLKVFTY